MLSTYRSRPYFPCRSPAGVAEHQPYLPVCAAFRIVARRAVEFASGLLAVTDSVWPSAPTGLRDGAYPVLVRRTDSRDGDLTELFLVDSDSWYLAPCGRNWRVEYVLQAGGAAGDRFCYTVETVEHLEELA